jgi:hypothetical protein
MVKSLNINKLFFLLSVLLSVIVFQIFIRSTLAATAPTIALSPNSVQAATGSTFTLNVDLNPGTSQVSAVDLVVTYDPVKLQAQSLQAGSAMPVVLVPAAVGGGKATVTLGANVGSPLTTSASIATLTFKVLQSGSTNVNVDSATQVAVIGQVGNALSGRTGTVVNASSPTATPNSTGSTITVTAAGTLEGGIGPTMRLQLNTTGGFLNVKSWDVGTNLQTFVYTSTSKITHNQVRVAFTNDACCKKGDRNLQVTNVNIDGVNYPTDAPGVLGSGVWGGRGLKKCSSGYFSSTWLSCNGYFQY